MYFTLLEINFYLVLPPPPDIPAGVDLFLRQVAAHQHAVKIVHRAVDNTLGSERDTKLEDDFFVT